ncbi:MAG: hypothetical protein ABIK28_09065, partial [Planctomycetota bacterium]
MTPAKLDTICLIPGPGPLSWLFPELLTFRGTGRIPESANVSSMDLGASGLAGDSLKSRILELAPDRIEFQNGPRGYTLWLWLSQKLRNEGIELVRPSHLPSLTGAALEDLLFQAVEGVESGFPVLLKSPDSKRMGFQNTPLSQAQAESMNSIRTREKPLVWVLPFIEGPDLLQRIQNASGIIADSPVPFRRARLIPLFITRLPQSPNKDLQREAPVETRLLPSWWGLLPGDGWSQEVRAAFHKLLRQLYPERYFQYAAFENLALAGIDCYYEGLMNRSENLDIPSRKRQRPVIIGICGTDGSGKSSHVAALKTFLRNQGLSVDVHKIYRHGVFHETVTDLTRQCAGGHNLHLWRLQRIVKVFDSMKYLYSSLQEDFRDLDVVIFDRYIYTHYAAG